jgi:hypothetical protein
MTRFTVSHCSMWLSSLTRCQVRWALGLPRGEFNALVKIVKGANLAHNFKKSKRCFPGIYLEEEDLKLYSLLVTDQIRPKQMVSDNCRWQQPQFKKSVYCCGE